MVQSPVSKLVVVKPCRYQREDTSAIPRPRGQRWFDFRTTWERRLILFPMRLIYTRYRPTQSEKFISFSIRSKPLNNKPARTANHFYSCASNSPTMPSHSLLKSPRSNASPRHADTNRPHSPHHPPSGEDRHAPRHHPHRQHPARSHAPSPSHPYRPTKAPAEHHRTPAPSAASNSAIVITPPKES